MIIYATKGDMLSQVADKPFLLERDIQKIFETNLKLITGLLPVRSEFSIKHKRIDTLAFDPETKSFVIIEYKRDRNHSVVDQGVSYLNLMLDYKADFIVEYNESCRENLLRSEVDWSQTRVIFVSTAFTENQKQATNFKDLAIELCEIRGYENGLVTIEIIKKSPSAPSIKQIANNSESLKKVAAEIKVYTEDDILELGTQLSRSLYEHFKNSILNLDPDIEVQPKKRYVAFKKTRNIADITVLKKGIKIWINLKKGKLDDPKLLTEDVSQKGHWGNGDYQIIAQDGSNLEYIMFLIKQAI